ncbi:sorbosone dehydrogenase [bacterium]|nr:sorbosone dehydrogenase [bacterium]
MLHPAGSPMFQRSALFVMCLFAPIAAYAQRDLTDIPVPDPMEELKTFVVAKGFEVNLFAADPQIHKPIQINFDPQGRLWVAASEVYPQIAPGQIANDKILILEDTDGDGISDKTTVFADGLLIPTAVIPGDGGAYVANSTELLHLTDTDGDGKADQSRIVLSGFGTEDTHHILHTFRWGPECLFYMNQSIYIHSHVETPYGVKRLNAGGIWRFRPETLQLDVLARGWVNTWGHAFDKWGQSFVTDGAGGEGINYLVPGAAYPTAYGVNEILHGLNPGSPKYCGLEIVDGRHLPEDWQGSLITHDFRGHRVCRFVVSDEGSGFSSQQMPDVISTNHVAFRPIDVKQGLDGAIYIADWYNPIIQHGEVDFRDPRRDHTHGRIWRVTAKGRPLVPQVKLVDMPVRYLLNELNSPEMNTRTQAKRVLKERGADVVLPELASWVRHLDIERADYEPRLLEALWMYQAFDTVNLQVLTELLAAGSPQIRAAAVRVVPHWADRIDQPEELLAKAVHDEYPRVRLEAVRALAAIPTVRSAELALAVIDHPLDGFLAYATRQTCREMKPIWLPAVIHRQFNTEGHLARLIFAIEAAEATESIPLLVESLQSGELSAEERPRLLQLIGALGAPKHLRLVFDLSVAEKTSPEEANHLLQALIDAKQRRNVQPAGDLNALSRWFQGDSTTLKVQAITAAGLWKIESLKSPLIELASRKDGPPEVSLAAIQSLSMFGDAAAIAALTQIARESDSEPIRGRALMELVNLAPAKAAESSIRWWQNSHDTGAQLQVMQAFLQKKGAADVLAAALDGQKIPEDVAKIGLRAVTGSGRPEPALSAALTKAGGITNEPKMLTPEEMQALVAVVKEQGNPAHGEAIFRRADLSCFKCHAIGGAGGKVGPDLISIGASAQVDYLIDSLLLPNKNVKEGYQTAVVLTDEGKVLTGVKVRQSDTALIIRDAEDKELSIPLNTIEEVNNGSTLMPVGLTEKLTRAELIDLVRFLSELGKPGPYAVGTQPVARQWVGLLPTDDSYRRLTRTSDAQLMADDTSLTWALQYATVSGELPLSGLPTFGTKVKLVQSNRYVSFVRTFLQTTMAGETVLQWNDVTGLQIWIDGQPANPATPMKLELPEGRHSLSVAIDLNVRQTPLKLELLPSTSGAKFVAP